MSEIKMSKHTVLSQYRVLAAALKSIVLAVYPGLRRFKAGKNVQRFILDNFSEFLLNQPEGTEFVIALALLQLSKSRRTKTNIQNILLSSQSVFKQTLKKFEIELGDLDFPYLPVAQERVRAKICAAYESDKDYCWQLASKQIKNKKNLALLRPLIDTLFIQERLVWKVSQKEKNRLNIKKILESSNEISQAHSNSPSPSTAIQVQAQGEQSLGDQLPELPLTGQKSITSTKNVELRQIGEESLNLHASWPRDVGCQSGLSYCDDCPWCCDSSRFDTLLWFSN